VVVREELVGEKRVERQKGVWCWSCGGDKVGGEGDSR